MGEWTDERIGDRDEQMTVFAFKLFSSTLSSTSDISSKCHSHPPFFSCLFLSPTQPPLSLSFSLSLLQAFDQSELLECIRCLVETDQDWVPHSDSAGLYIRPTFISTEVRRIVKCCNNKWRQKFWF